MKGLQPSGIRRRNKMIYAAVVLFLENGYEKTTTAQIARRAGMSATSFFAAFPNKEAILYALVREMFAEQFKWTERLLGERPDPLLLYCAETALQIHITELSPELRELYMTAYSLQSTSEYIYQNISKKLETFFAPYLPGAQASDFYELEIASAGVMRGFMGRPCDLYFTIERKLRRFLSCCMRLYCVPEEKQEQVIARVLQMDLRTQAQEIVELATQRAQEILDKATTEANEMRAAAISYTDDNLGNVEDILSHSIDIAAFNYEKLMTQLQDCITIIQNNRAQLYPVDEMAQVEADHTSSASANPADNGPQPM